MRNMYFSTRNDKELFIEWYKNGIIRRKGHTNRENKEIGKWYFYNEKGSLIKVKDCDKEDCNKP